MKDSRDDYLKAIYEESIEQADQIATNKALAARLEVTPSSISEMVGKLSEVGLIENIPYKGCKLTEAGLDECLKIVRSHMLWEVFLMEHLKFTWREAHEDAHLLEHATTDRILERLDEFLGRPQVCPHGSNIPRKVLDNLEEDNSITLNNLEINSSAIINRIEEEGKLLDYLWNLELKIGKKIEVISKGDYEGPILLLQEGKEISVSYKAAKQIYVKQI